MTEYMTVIGQASTARGIARGDDIDELRLDDFVEDQGTISLLLDHDAEIVGGPVLYAERSALGVMVVGRVQTSSNPTAPTTTGACRSASPGTGSAGPVSPRSASTRSASAAPAPKQASGSTAAGSAITISRRVPVEHHTA